jgi:hypothetical protein
MPILRSPAVYIPALEFGRPISLGAVHILQSGISVPSNIESVTPSMLEDVFYNDEGGDQIQVSQPLATTKGGVLYSGQPDVVRQFYTDAPSYIVAVYSSSGALQYYDTMSDTFGGSGGGGSAGAASIINDWNLAVTPGFYQDASTASLNQPVSGRRFIGWVANSNESGDSIVQVVADVTQANGPLYVRVKSLGIFGGWRQQWDAASFGRQASALDNTANAALLVGAGGLGALYNSRFAQVGGNSSLGSLLAFGGGNGASWTWQSGGNGGSGGGGSHASGTGGPGTGIAGQGNNGGQGAG